MKYQIKIGERIFVVEIDDINARPIIAVVNGDPIEVWPQEDQKPILPYPTVAKQEQSKSLPSAQTNSSVRITDRDRSSNVVYAPIPGVITSVTIKPGDCVAFGQELCILEAMKMKNVIRATKAGVISSIHVSVGQQVKHHDILMEYAES